MISKKRIRAITGFTYSKQRADADSWYKSSVSYYESTIVLNENKDRISNSLPVILYNSAMSLELIIKAILVANGKDIPKTHNLKELCDKAGVKLKEDQKHTLDLLTEIIKWRGKYPVPKTEEQWDNFHDIIFEKHKIRIKSGNTYQTLANLKRFPTFEKNYKSIWETCVSTYGSVLPNQSVDADP